MSMKRKIYVRGVVGSFIVLALMLVGLLPKPLVEAARKESANVQKTSKQQLVEAYGKIPLSFERNAGQSSNEVKFLSRGPGYTLFLTRHAEAVVVLSATAAPHDPRGSAPASVFRMKLRNARVTPQADARSELPGK